MNLIDVLNSPITNLPILFSEKKTIRGGLKEVFNGFLKTVSAAKDLPVGLVENLTVLIHGLLETLDHYYEGKPSDAYNSLNNCLRESTAADYLEKKGTIKMNSDLYRIRKKNSNYPLEKCDLFHIPFDKRGLVRTQRYSIPGLPSLYVSNCIYVAWEEMSRPDIIEIQAVRLQNRRLLRVLDLTTDGFNNKTPDENLTDWEVQSKLLTWPLIAACSIKVKNLEDTFKPEYIIPQLLLQWINKSMLDGIKYSSTHINTSEKIHKANFFNLVLPVKEFAKDEGYCNQLAGIFDCTEVLPMQLRSFATVSHQFSGQGSPSIKVNPDVITLELVKGQEQMYWSTSFGVLEHALKGLKLGPVLESI